MMRNMLVYRTKLIFNYEVANGLHWLTVTDPIKEMLDTIRGCGGWRHGHGTSGELPRAEFYGTSKAGSSVRWSQAKQRPGMPYVVGEDE
jgi:hypothetical protein